MGNNDFIVAKFGGSSLASAEQLKKVKAITDMDERRRYIVPSAPGKRNSADSKVTDLLYAVKKQVLDGEKTDKTFAEIRERFVGMRNELGIDFDIEKHLNIVENDIINGASLDYTASRGEYLNGLLLAAYLNFEFVDAADVIFFDAHGHLDLGKTESMMSGRLKHCERAVIPGFYGSAHDGEVKTFSRGGSDITGAIVARAVSATVYENWTDVSGFMMADPRIVKSPKTIERITYRELRELSYMGASVLHEDAVFPVSEVHIPINIKNTNDPEHPGTMIVSKVGDDKDSVITGIAGKRNFTVIAIEKNRMNAEVGFGRKVLEALEENQVSFEHMPSGIDTLSLVIADECIDGKLKKVKDDIYRVCKPDVIEEFSNMALIAVVGRGMRHQVGTAAKIFNALSKAKVNVRMIDQGSSEINIIIGVENDEFDAAMIAIYNEFN
ncbi:MAG: aspartate kinase [Eubacteriales bacterium]